MKIDTADIISCNDDYGVAEMVVRINKEFYDAKSGTQSQTPVGFKIDGENYVQTVRPEKNKLRLSANKEDLEFHHTVIIDSGLSHTYGNEFQRKNHKRE